jgi:hypothetical protein
VIVVVRNDVMGVSDVSEEFPVQGISPCVGSV